MKYLIGLIGIVVGAAGFWMDFSSHPDMAADSPLGSIYFDVGAAGILVATLCFMIQIVTNALPRRPRAAIAADLV
jgi:hypothetical protein